VTGRLQKNEVLNIFKTISDQKCHEAQAIAISKRSVQRQRTYARRMHYVILAASILFSAVCRAQSWSTLVDSESLNQVGKVYRTVTHVDGVHHADAQLELNAAVIRKPVELFQGGSDVVARSEVHYEASSGLLNLLQRSDRRHRYRPAKLELQ